MSDKWRKIDIFDVQRNVFDLIGKQWMLITVGNKDRWNTMTASWGQMGVLWNLPVVTIYVRPERYTFEFLKEAKGFSLNFLPEEYRGILNKMGSRSGRDFDKMNRSGLTAFETPSGEIAFDESELWMDCQELYEQDLNPDLFYDERIKVHYRNGGIHRMIVAEIKGVYVK